MTNRSPHEVILVHGLWFGAWAMARLARRLQAEGFAVRRFAYPSTAGRIDEHADRLLEFSRQTRAGELHFIGHSLGGLVILHMLDGASDLPPGRVVLLGSPLAGSAVARQTRRIPGSRKLLGRVRKTLERGYGTLSAGRETGMIAGTRAIGLGLLVGGAGRPGDGTVSVDETRTVGLKDHLLLPVNHTGLVYAPEVARQAAIFLRTGSFEWPAAC